MAIQKAYLKAETGSKIEFMFNPSELKFTKRNSWTPGKPTGANAPQLQFTGGGSVEFSLTAVFDSTASGKPVTAITDELFKLTMTDKKIKGTKEDRNMTRPPSKGEPLRAEVSMSFQQFEDEESLPPQNPTSGTPNPGQIRRLESGQYLDTIAEDIYGDPSRWRTIADANGIDDPLALRPGQIVVIPEGET